MRLIFTFVFGLTLFNLKAQTLYDDRVDSLYKVGIQAFVTLEDSLAINSFELLLDKYSESLPVKYICTYKIAETRYIMSNKKEGKEEFLWILKLPQDPNDSPYYRKISQERIKYNSLEYLGSIYFEEGNYDSALYYARARQAFLCPDKYYNEPIIGLTDFYESKIAFESLMKLENYQDAFQELLPYIFTPDMVRLESKKYLRSLLDGQNCHIKLKSIPQITYQILDDSSELSYQLSIDLEGAQIPIKKLYLPEDMDSKNPYLAQKYYQQQINAFLKDKLCAD